MTFSEEAVERLVGALYQLHAAGTAARAPQAMADALGAALRCDLALVLAVDAAQGVVHAAAWPAGARLPALSAALVDWHRRAHPLLRQLARDRSIRAWRLCDVAGAGGPPPGWAAVYGALPARHQMVMRLASPDGRLHAVALARGRDEFSDAERRSLELLWPHLVRALRATQQARRGRPGAAPADERPREARGIVLLDAALRVELATERARLWLAEYFPGTVGPRRPELPRVVVDWARRRCDGERVGMRNPLTERRPLVQPLGERYLVLDLIVDHGRGEHLLTLAEEVLVAPADSLRSLGLTARESEVLAWVAQGKTNDEIGAILGASGRTVQKHLEHMYQKLGVESRTAATLRAWQAARFALLGRTA